VKSVKKIKNNVIFGKIDKIVGSALVVLGYNIIIKRYKGDYGLWLCLIRDDV